MKASKLKWILGFLSLSCLAALFFMERVPQDIEYHLFVDNEVLLNISNFHNVISNLPFLIVAILGFSFLIKNGHYFTKEEGAMSWTLVSGIALIGFGSAFYHYNPSNFSLIWDRIPMTIVFASLFSLILYDLIEPTVGWKVFAVFLPFGIMSVVYWWISESLGFGDLRPYIFVQFFPMMAIPLMLILTKNKSNLRPLILMTLFYFLAKYFEQNDSLFMDLISYSGHSLKHLCAALAVYFSVSYLKNRIKV